MGSNLNEMALVFLFVLFLVFSCYLSLRYLFFLRRQVIEEYEEEHRRKQNIKKNRGRKYVSK